MDTTIENRIRLIRIETNLNQTQFAKSLNISQSKLSQIEKGIVQADAAFLTAMYAEYRINPSWLLFGTGIRIDTEKNKTLDPNDFIYELEILKAIEKLNRSTLTDLQKRIDSAEISIKQLQFITKQ